MQARRRRRETLLKSLQETFERLQLYTNGIKPFANNEAAAQILNKHLLKGVGIEVVDFLLLYQEVSRVGRLVNQQTTAKKTVSMDGRRENACMHQAEHEDVPERSKEEAESLSAADRTALLWHMPSDTAASATAAVEALNGASAQVIYLKLH